MLAGDNGARAIQDHLRQIFGVVIIVLSFFGTCDGALHGRFEESPLYVNKQRATESAKCLAETILLRGCA